ncbi:MAG: hypothetical protein IT460_06650 [Planctomycetes bacterium]|nr:hypothetical protein [Planctomycetota bacterium]
MRARSLVVGLLLVLGSAAPSARGEDALAWESFPVLRATEMIEPALREGPGFRVHDAAVSDAFVATWELETPYGLFLCPSLRLLQVRVRELAAIQRAAAAAPEDEVLRGAQSRLLDIPTAAVKLVEDPLATLEGVGKGAERTLGRVGDLFSKRKKTKYEDGGVDAFLFSAEKRKVAAELGVDVYSTNSKLQSFLGDIAKARRAGGFAVDLAKSAVPGGAGTALSGLSTVGDLTTLLRDLTPAELDRVADDKLTRAGVDAFLRRQFLSTRALSPRHRTTISAAVEALAGVRDLDALVSAACESQTEVQALLHEEQAAYFVRQHRSDDPLVSLDASGGLVAGFCRSGRMLVCAPVDVLPLVPDVVSAADALLAMPAAAGATSRTVWINGRVTPKAAAYLASRGFSVEQDGRIVPAAALR